MRTFLVQVKPGSKREAVSEASPDLEDKGIKYIVRVVAKPDGGKANRAVERLLAKHFQVALGDVSIISGTQSRIKRIRIEV